MQSHTDELDRAILSAVSEDFEPLESIVRKVSIPEGRFPELLEPGKLDTRLICLVADRLISAYLLHADPPFITPVDIRHEKLSRAWFLITERGMKCLGPEPRATSPKLRRPGAGDGLVSIC